MRLTAENAKKIEDEYGVGAEWLLTGMDRKKIILLAEEWSNGDGKIRKSVSGYGI